MAENLAARNCQDTLLRSYGNAGNGPWKNCSSGLNVSQVPAMFKTALQICGDTRNHLSFAAVFNEVNSGGSVFSADQYATAIRLFSLGQSADL